MGPSDDWIGQVLSRWFGKPPVCVRVYNFGIVRKQKLCELKNTSPVACTTTTPRLLSTCVATFATLASVSSSPPSSSRRFCGLIWCDVRYYGLIQCFVRLLPSISNRNNALTLKKRNNNANYSSTPTTYSGLCPQLRTTVVWAKIQNLGSRIIFGSQIGNCLIPASHLDPLVAYH